MPGVGNLIMTGSLTAVFFMCPSAETRTNAVRLADNELIFHAWSCSFDTFAISYCVCKILRFIPWVKNCLSSLSFAMKETGLNFEYFTLLLMTVGYDKLII